MIVAGRMSNYTKILSLVWITSSGGLTHLMLVWVFPAAGWCVRLRYTECVFVYDHFIVGLHLFEGRIYRLMCLSELLLIIDAAALIVWFILLLWALGVRHQRFLSLSTVTSENEPEQINPSLRLCGSVNCHDSSASSPLLTPHMLTIVSLSQTETHWCCSAGTGLERTFAWFVYSVFGMISIFRCVSWYPAFF